MKYLKKRNLYKLVVEKLAYPDMSKCKDCSYKFFGGYEWLSFCTTNLYIKVSSMGCGRWMRVREYNDDICIRDEVIIRF